MGRPTPHSFFGSPSLIIATLWILLLSISLFGSFSTAKPTTHVVYLSHNDQIGASNSDADNSRVDASLAAGSRNILNTDTQAHNGDDYQAKSTGFKRVTVLEGDAAKPEHLCHPPHLVKLNIVFDAIIALAYFSIPIEVAYFYHRHPTPQLFWVYVLFFSFIMLCGITHAIHALSPYELPTLHATFKVLCGLVSIITAVYLVKFIPAALKLPNYTAYLEYEIQERQISETTLRNKNEESKKLRSITEKIRQTLQIQSIFLETTSSLCAQLDLDSCSVIRYNPANNALQLMASFTADPYSPSDIMPHSLRADNAEAIATFHAIAQGDHVRFLDAKQLEDLFGKSVLQRYNHKVASLQVSKSTVCTHLSLPDSETALLVLPRPAEGTVWSVSEIELVRDVANQVEIALAQARSIERDKDMLLELQRKNRELEQTQQRAELATQAKSKFIAIMSHEMRTPLYVVTALTELLMDTQLTSEQKESLATIQTSSRLLLSIISDVLDYSKFQQDNFVMDKAPFNIRTCLEKCIDISAVKSHEAGLEIYYYLREGFPEIVDTDEARLSQVFLNLLSNAVKFTQQGHLTVEGYLDRYLTNEEIAQLYSTQYAKSDTSSGSSGTRKARSSSTSSSSSSSSSGSQIGTGGMSSSSSLPHASGATTLRNMPPPGTKMAMLHFIVSDTGVGISQDQVPRLFQEFSQLDSSVSRKYEGSGLGLAICRKVVTLMGGAIWVDSTPGVGSHFHFTIIAKIPPPSLCPNLFLPNSGVRGLHVLIITASVHMRRQLTDFARECTVNAQFAKDIPAAYKIIRRAATPFACILVDVNSIGYAAVAQEEFGKLNNIAATVVIGDAATAASLALENGSQINLPLKHQNFYQALLPMSGSHTDHDVSTDRFLAEMISTGGKPRHNTSESEQAAIANYIQMQGLVRSSSGNSVSSSSSNDSTLASPRRLEPMPTLSSSAGSSNNASPSLGPISGLPPPTSTGIPFSLSHISSQNSSLMGAINAMSEKHTSAGGSMRGSFSSSTYGEDPDSTHHHHHHHHHHSPHSHSGGTGTGGAEQSDAAVAPLTMWTTGDEVRVLLVEDNTVCRKVCLKQLKKLGFERVDIAVNGQDALDQVKERRYDLLMMDVMMPGVDGLSATRAIRQMGDDALVPRTQQPYIIAITASSMLEEGSREACLLAGMDDVVNKPIHLRALHDAIHRYFEAKRAS